MGKVWKRRLLQERIAAATETVENLIDTVTGRNNIDTTATTTETTTNITDTGTTGTVKTTKKTIKTKTKGTK